MSSLQHLKDKSSVYINNINHYLSATLSSHDINKIETCIYSLLRQYWVKIMYCSYAFTCLGANQRYLLDNPEFWADFPISNLKILS